MRTFELRNVTKRYTEDQDKAVDPATTALNAAERIGSLETITGAQLEQADPVVDGVFACNVQSDLVATYDARVLGKALNQFVMPGFAAYRLGIEESDHPIVITPGDGREPEVDEHAEEEEASAHTEDATPRSVDARDHLEDS